MNKLFSLFAILGVAVLIGAGCAQTEETTTTTNSTNESVTVEIEDEDVAEEESEESEEASEDETTEEATTETSEETTEEEEETTEVVEEETTEETTEETVEETSSTEYTLDDIASHDSASDCWMAIDGGVYDVTEFISSHPGGSAILRGCGIDATSAFEAQGHSSSADEIKEGYQIGTLAQ